MKYLFDENTPPAIAKVLKTAFEKENDKSFYWITDAPFRRGMPDEEIFNIIANDSKWCIVSFDKFRGHPLKMWAEKCLVLRLEDSEWVKPPFPVQCYRFIKIFHHNSNTYKKTPKGRVYILKKSGSLKDTRKR